MKARTEDVSSIDGIIKAFYEIVSGPAGAARDWDRERTLSMEGVRFVRLSAGEKREVPKVTIMSLDDWIQGAEPILLKGFYEWEIHRITYAYGNIAHVLSTYISRETENGPIIDRGVNSIQLFLMGFVGGLQAQSGNGKQKIFLFPQLSCLNELFLRLCN